MTLETKLSLDNSEAIHEQSVADVSLATPSLLPAFPRKPLNTTISNCPPSGIRRFFDIAQTMENVISLGVGEPDFVTPRRIREAAIRALDHGGTTYTANAGLLSLRKSICKNLSERYNAHYNPETECVVTVGVSEGLDLAFRVLLNPGDEVLVPDPDYVSYAPCIEFAGGIAVPVPTSAKDGFRLHAEAIEAAITPRTKALLIGSPANPTGATQSREDLQKLVDMANQHDFYLVSDEIYDRLTYLGEHTCLGSLPGARDRTIVLNGFSKAYAMTGWRVGYTCAPEPISRLILRMHQYTMLCAPHLAQIAALEALDHAEEDVQAMIADYALRRRFFVDGLNAIGLDCGEPQGAFYAFPLIKSTGLTSEEFAERLLMEERVAVVPGGAFGKCGEGHVRCSYATSMSQLTSALEKTGRFVERVKAEPGNSRNVNVSEPVTIIAENHHA
ncbi:MAG: aminotransferase class I/II-fold pyridoxal phosphate-dependent enzyme [Chthonomonadaceae bacterium]|nr:aminotransferase class I/II-fold pyridoxal phosphate-dependent enzyme [Chthonomonadaceae bacterium]